jgi:Effector-associated domain 2
MRERQPAVYRAILVVDVEGFSGEHRTEDHRRLVRERLREILGDALSGVGFDLAGGDSNDTGDGMVVVIGAEVPEARLVHPLPAAVEAGLREHNSRYADGAQIRLRLSLHHGQVFFDEAGMSGEAIIHACRLLDSQPLRNALKRAHGPLALVVSDDFYRHVVRNEPAAAPDSYTRIDVTTKEGEVTAWIRVHGETVAESPAWLVPAVTGGGSRLTGQIALAFQQLPELADVASRARPAGYRGTPEDALHELTEALLRVPSMLDPASRKEIVAELPREIRASIPHQSRARMDVRAILRTCVTRDGGFGMLLTAVRRVEGDTLDLDALREDVFRILTSLAQPE